MSIVVSEKDLDIVISIANSIYGSKEVRPLTDKQFMARCWIEAVIVHFKLDADMIFPSLPLAFPTDED